MNKRSSNTGLTKEFGALVIVIALIVGVAVAVDAGSERPTALVAALVVIAFTLFVATLKPFRPSRAESADDELLRMSRWFLYAGLLTSSAGIFRPVADLTSSDWLFAAAGGLAVLGSVRSRNHPVADTTSKLLIFGLVLFVVGGMLSSSRADSTVASMLVVLRVALVVAGLSWVARTVLVNQTHVRRATLCWCTAAAASGLAAAVAASTGFVPPGAFAQWGRYSGLAEHPNDLGALTALTVVPAIYLVTRRQSAASAVIAWALLAGIAGGVLLSGSVNALLTAAITVLCWVVLTRRHARVLVASATVAAVTLFVALMVVPSGTETPFSRLSISGSGIETSDQTVNARTETNKEAIEQIGQDPMLGQGFGDGTTDAGFEVHNIVLQVWFEGGILAMTGIVMILAAMAMRGVRSVRASARTRSLDADLPAALTSSLIGFFVYAMAALLLYKRFAWVSPALVTAAYFVALGHTRGAVRATSSPLRARTEVRAA